MEGTRLNQSVEKRKITDPTRILTLANLISLLRALLTVPIIYTLQNPFWRTYTFILIVLAILSDALDGFFARRAHEVTHFGKWLDPIADSVVILTVAAYLVLQEQFPAWFFFFYLVRYVTIAVPAIYLLNHVHFVLNSNWYGKWAAGISAMAIFFHIFPIYFLDWLPHVSLLVATSLLALSWLVYWHTFIQQFRSL